MAFEMCLLPKGWAAREADPWVGYGDSLKWPCACGCVNALKAARCACGRDREGGRARDPRLS